MVHDSLRILIVGPLRLRFCSLVSSVKSFKDIKEVVCFFVKFCSTYSPSGTPRLAEIVQLSLV